MVTSLEFRVALETEIGFRSQFGEQSVPLVLGELRRLTFGPEFGDLAEQQASFLLCGTGRIERCGQLGPEAFALASCFCEVVGGHGSEHRVRRHPPRPSTGGATTASRGHQ